MFSYEDSFSEKTGFNLLLNECSGSEGGEEIEEEDAEGIVWSSEEDFFLSEEEGMCLTMTEKSASGERGFCLSSYEDSFPEDVGFGSLLSECSCSENEEEGGIGWSSDEYLFQEVKRLFRE